MTQLYRPNVGIVVFNQTGNVLFCARSDRKEYCWQFPQGGIEKDEPPPDAALRELREETGIHSVKLVAQAPKPLRYDFPDFIKLPFKGQQQHWFLFYFTGQDNEINFELNSQEIEFKAYKWASIDLAPKMIVEFKKGVYNEVVKVFKPLIKQYLKG